MDLEQLLKQVEAGDISAEEAFEQARAQGETTLEFARVDTDRARRCGLSEVVFAPGKTGEQIADIMQALVDAGQNCLVSRASEEQFTTVKGVHPDAAYDPVSRTITLDPHPLPAQTGLVAVVCAGTSDIPVAEEAAVVAERMGCRVERIYDAGVAGLHRILKHTDTLREARAVVVAAGMEGALPSVVGGLIARPIIAVPTSIGYGSSLNGVAALLAMLNSCVPGISVVNIDNGFSAGVSAALINRGSGDS